MKKWKKLLVEIIVVVFFVLLFLFFGLTGINNLKKGMSDKSIEKQVDVLKDAAVKYVSSELMNLSFIDDKLELSIADLSLYLSSTSFNDVCMSVQVTRERSNFSYKVQRSCSEWDAVKPRLSEQMIPIVYNGKTWIKTDSSNFNNSWFNYSKQQWANVAIVTPKSLEYYQDAPVGMEVMMTSINEMYVWIPRFRLLNSLENQPSGLIFEYVNPSNLVNLKSREDVAHPSFTVDGQEINGFWVGKFKTGYKGALAQEDAYMNDIDSTRIVVKPLEYSWMNSSNDMMAQAIGGMNQEEFLSTQYHLFNDDEREALDYLTQSIYGKSGNQFYLTNDRTVLKNTNLFSLTGCGKSYDFEDFSLCHAYHTNRGMASSTTGNVSGVYDVFDSTMDSEWQESRIAVR